MYNAAYRAFTLSYEE